MERDDKAKLCASIRWLVSKAYSSSAIPPDIKTPFFKDKEGEDHLRPAVIYQLSSGELYSLACANIFPPSVHQWQGHWSVISGLSRHGIYVIDDKRQPVTEAVLTQTQRIKLNAHLAVMDAIMTAYTGEVVNIEKIVQAVRRITTFNASSELPFDLENALVFWVNKVCTAEIYRMERERRNQQEQQLMQTKVQKVRIRRQQLQPKEPPSVPTIKNVTKDISDGRCLCLLIHHYCPHLFSLDDVDLHETVSFAESVHNLEQVETFLDKYLPDTHHFTFEDLLYSPEVLRVNIIALFAELFHWFEVEKPYHLEIGQDPGQKVPATPEGRSRVQQLPPLPISSATKKSFHGDASFSRSELRSAASNPEVNRITSASPQRSQSLLIHRDMKKRDDTHTDQGLANLRRASSLENLEVKESFLAWQGQEESRDSMQSTRDSKASSLLANVSIDSDLNDSQNFSQMNSLNNQNGRLPKVSDGLADHERSSSLSQFENDEDMEVESLTSALSRMSKRNEKPVSHNLNEESKQRSSVEENGRLTDQDFTVTPLSSMSSKESSEWQKSQSEIRHINANQSPVRNNQSHPSRTNNNREYDILGAVEQDIQKTTVTPSRRRLKLDIQPVEMKRTERLLPAVVKPLKEKSHNMNKKEESGEGRRIGRNSREDHHGKLPDANGGSMTTWSRKQGAAESPESLEATTPLSGESIADSLAGDVTQQCLAWQMPRPGIAPQGNPTPDTNSQELHVTQTMHSEAFFIHTHTQPEQSLGSSSLNRTGTGSSFTVADKQHTASSAFEAGIPVVSSLAELQGMEDEDEESYNHQASPRHSTAHPNLHAAPSHNPVSASHPAERFSGNPHPYPNPSPRLHDQSNPHMHETAFKPNPLHSGGDVPGRSLADNPRGPNTGMDTYNNIPHPSSMEKESSKLHADQTQKESGSGVCNPVLMTFDTNLSPDKLATSTPEFQFHSTSSLANGNNDQIPWDQEPDLNNQKSQLSLNLPLDTNHSTESADQSVLNPDSSLNMHSKLELTPHNQPITVEYPCMPLESANKELDNQVLTTWGANSKQTPLCGINTGGGNPNQANNQLSLGEFTQVRARLEEKRRFMDSDKRKLERQWSKQRQRVGKAAFLQVLANQKKVKENASEDQPIRTEEFRSEKPKMQDVYSREEIERSIARSRLDQSQQEGKITFADLGSNKDRLVPSRSAESSRIQKVVPTNKATEISPIRPESPQSIPDAPPGKGSPGSSSGSHSPHMTSDEYNTSLEKLNANLSQLQNEIQRLSLRQEQMRSVMESPRPPSERSNSPQQAPPVDTKPFVLHSGGDVPPESQGFFLSQSDKEPEAFVLHENPLYDMSGADIPSPRPVGPVQRLPPQLGQGSITRSTDQPQILKSPYPANHVPSNQTNSTYIIPPAHLTTSKSKESVEIPKNESPQNQTKVLASTPANEQPKNADSLTNQHQPPLPTVASLSNHMTELSKKDKSTAEVTDTPDVQKKQRNRKDTSSSTTKKRSSLYEIVGEGDDDDDYSTDEERLVVRPLDSTGNVTLDDLVDPEQKAQGFVVAVEMDQEEEVEKRKMQFLQNRLKKQEEERAKRVAREADMEKKREQQRRKQEEIEAKKAEEKARKEQIRQNYQRRKLLDQQENEPPAPVRRTKSSSKPRPKSTIVEDHADFGRPATSRYGQDKDYDDYSPKLYVKPTTKSNRHIITNAISHCVLAGEVNKEHKDKVLEELAKADAKHFIILFRDAQLQFRSVYSYSPDSEELWKLFGVGPRHITHKMYENLYKYNSGSKQFSKIPSKTMSVSVDGLTIASSYWLSKKGTNTKKR